jgi:uncharacterized protein
MFGWLRPPPREAAAGPPGLQGAMDAEAHYLRMYRLRQMGAVELRALLAGDPVSAAPWIESAARYGVAEAQVRLGQMRLDGIGARRDEDAALAWFTRAALRGDPDGMNMAGRCHENGWGGPVDLARAADWYRQAAEAGHDWGEYNYANMLFDGRGVARDQAQAAALYRRAAGRGHARAMNLLARCLEEGWGVERDPLEASHWYRRSAEGGYFRAQYNHATLLAGAGRIEEALGWFETACRGAAPESLGGMVEGLIHQRDPRLAALGRRLADSLAVTAAPRSGALLP